MQTGSLLADSLQSQENELSSAQINHAIVRARSFTAVLGLVCEHGHKFNHINAATAVHRVAKHRPQALGPVLGHAGWQRLLQVLSSQMERFEPRHVFNALWALGTLRQKPKQLLGQLLAALPSALSKGNEQVVSNALWGIATLQIQPGRRLLLAADKQLLRVLPKATPQAVSNSMWSTATLEHTPSRQLSRDVARRFVETVQTAEPQSVANLLWAYATLGIHPGQQLLEASAKQLLAAMQVAISQHVASAVWAYSQLGYYPGDAFMLAAVCHGVQRQNVRSRSPPLLSLQLESCLICDFCRSPCRSPSISRFWVSHGCPLILGSTM